MTTLRFIKSTESDINGRERTNLFFIRVFVEVNTTEQRVSDLTCLLGTSSHHKFILLYFVGVDWK